MFGSNIEFTNVDIYRKEMELNFFGLLHVIKSFVPLLKSKDETRFIAVTSIIGLMPALITLSGYGASKAASEFLLNTARIELSSFNIKFININPGITNTPFLSNFRTNVLNAWDSMDKSIKDTYDPNYGNNLAETNELVATMLASYPDDAVYSIVEAATNKYPKTRYYAGWDARLLMRCK